MADEVRSMKWWGWGDEGTGFRYPATGPTSGLDIRSGLELSAGSGLRFPAGGVRIHSCCPSGRPTRRFWPSWWSASEAARVLRRQTKNGSPTPSARAFAIFGECAADPVDYAPDCRGLPGFRVEDVATVVDAAARHQVGVIPFGGGTNIAGCLEPLDQAEPHDGLGVPRRMNRLLKLDAESETARFQAGVLGSASRSAIETLRLHTRPFPRLIPVFDFRRLGGHPVGGNAERSLRQTSKISSCR